VVAVMADSLDHMMCEIISNSIYYIGNKKGRNAGRHRTLSFL